MTRLDAFIARLISQRRLIDWAAEEIRTREGLVLELGLGNGRTYDHLRERLPGRTIFVFDREARAHPASMPPADQLVLGDIQATLPAFATKHGRKAVLVHADATTGRPEIDRVRLAWLPAAIAAVTSADGIVLSDAPLEHASLQRLELPFEIPSERYCAYRRIG